MPIGEFTQPAYIVNRNSYRQLTASAQVKAGAGMIHTLTVSPLSATPVAGMLTIYDSLTASGTIIHQEMVPAGALARTRTFDAAFTTGLYVSFDGTLSGVSVTVTYL